MTLRRFWLPCLFSVLVTGQTAFSQLPHTRLHSIFPPGGQAGTTFELKVTGGDDLEEISEMRFSHPGIQAKPRMVEGQSTPVENTFDVTVAADVPPGPYDAYVSGYWGLSNPRTFVVGTRAEILETEPNSEASQAGAVSVGTVVNGRLDQSTDVEWFRFTATAGSRVIVDCQSTRIDSRMQPVVEVYDLEGRKLCYERGVRGDAVLVFEPPRDGEYLLKLFDQTYRNGPEYFYRLLLHTGPQVAFVMPPAGQAGTTSGFTAYGFNLPGGQPTELKLDGVTLERLDVSIPVPADATLLETGDRVAPVESGGDAFTWRLDSPQGPSNPVRIGISDCPVVLESEPNNTPEQPQAISTPCDIGGQFAAVGDIDVYAFDVKAGDVRWIEVFGERIGSAVDPVLIVEHVTTDAEGKQNVNRLTVQDDTSINLAQNAFDTYTDDAAFRFAAPSDGQCRITLRDRYGETRGEPALAYRLVVKPETPDFRLVALPVQAGLGQTSAITFRKGDNFTFNVLAFRRHGFKGPIVVRVEGLPAGVSCEGIVIGPNQTSAPLVLRAAVDVAEFAATIRIVGHATLSPPNLVQAEQAAQAAVENASKPLADLRTAADSGTSKLQEALNKSRAALDALNASPGDANLETALAEAQKPLDGLLAAQKQALDGLLAGEQAFDAARAALQQARTARDAAAAQVDRPARIATVVWSGRDNRPAVSRVARELAVDVMKEAAAYQLQVDAPRVEVRQGGLVLVPVTLERRNGFDGEVQVTINGRPNEANIDGANFKFEKDQSKFLLPLFVKENSPPETYAIVLTGQAQVPYRRNPEKADRAKAVLDQRAAALTQAQEQAAQAETAKNNTVQKATEAESLLTQSQQAQTAAAERAKVAAEALNQAKAALETATTKAKESEAAVSNADAELKTAEQQLAGDAQNEELKQKVASTTETLTKAQESSRQAAADQKTAADKVTELDSAMTQAAAAMKTADEAFAAATAANTAAIEAKAAAEAAANEAKQAAETISQQRQEAEQAFNKANEAAAAKQLNFTPNSDPIVITVKPAPLKLAVSAGNGGELKRGQSLEIKGTVTRQNGFAGPVTLTLAVPEGIAGVTANSAVIPANKTEGTLTVTAAADATEGELKNIVVRAVSDHDGPANVDTPVVLKVSPQ